MEIYRLNLVRNNDPIIDLRNYTQEIVNSMNATGLEHHIAMISEKSICVVIHEDDGRKHGRFGRIMKTQHKTAVLCNDGSSRMFKWKRIISPGFQLSIEELVNVHLYLKKCLDKVTPAYERAIRASAQQVLAALPI